MMERWKVRHDVTLVFFVPSPIFSLQMGTMSHGTGVQSKEENIK